MEERDVWRVVPREPWMQVIDTHWMFDKKLDRDTAELLKQRARLVVKVSPKSKDCITMTHSQQLFDMNPYGCSSQLLLLMVWTFGL